jgi:hypothetical protein
MELLAKWLREPPANKASKEYCARPEFTIVTLTCFRANDERRLESSSKYFQIKHLEASEKRITFICAPG